MGGGGGFKKQRYAGAGGGTLRKRVWPVLVPRTALAAALNRCYQFNRAAPLAAEINTLADRMVKAALISQCEAGRIVSAAAERKMPFDQAVSGIWKSGSGSFGSFPGPIQTSRKYFAETHPHTRRVLRFPGRAAHVHPLDRAAGRRQRQAAGRANRAAPVCPSRWRRMKTACVWRSPTRL